MVDAAPELLLIAESRHHVIFGQMQIQGPIEQAEVGFHGLSTSRLKARLHLCGRSVPVLDLASDEVWRSVPHHLTKAIRVQASPQHQFPDL